MRGGVTYVGSTGALVTKRETGGNEERRSVPEPTLTCSFFYPLESRRL